MCVTPAATILSATDSSGVWGGTPYLIVGQVGIGGQQRIPPTDEVEVTRDRPALRRGRRDRVGGERRVRPEELQRDVGR